MAARQEQIAWPTSQIIGQCGVGHIVHTGRARGGLTATRDLYLVAASGQRPRHRDDRGFGASEGELYGVFAGDRKPQRMDDDLEWLDVQSFCQSGSSVSVPVNPWRVTETA